MAGNSISAVPEALLSVNSQQPFKGHALGVGLHTICQVCAQVTVAASDMMKLPGTESWLEETCTTTVREWLDRVEKKSCHLCYLLFQNVTRFDSEFHWWEPSLNLELIVSVWTTKSSLVLTPRIQREGKLAWQRPMSPPDPILIYNSAWSKVHPILYGEDLKRCNSTLSASTIAKIHQWLLTCKIEHGTQCSQAPAQPGQDRFLPKRLLDVNPRPGGVEAACPLRLSDIDRLSIDADPAIQLILADGLPSDIEYLTLSHCWGEHGPSIQLNDDTEPALLSGDTGAFKKALLASGSRTIRDAIHITRCLGFKYIWIDALCINQGSSDPEGKKAEIARMHHIYRGAALNLSAAEARDGTEGMIFERDILGVAPCVQRLAHDDSIDDGGTDGPRGTETGGHFVAYYRQVPVKAVSSTINSRGWVYQERLLSPRTVYFSREQVYWECPNLEVSEFEPWHTRTISRFQNHFKARSKSLVAPGPAGPWNLDLPEAQWIKWNEVCQGYTSTTVSIPSDRAVAFSAIARSVAEGGFADPQDYVAGFWKERLLRYLGWHRSTSQQEQHQSQAVFSGVPSWSWLSFHGSIDIKPGYIGEDGIQFCAEIVRIDLQNETIGDPFSAIRSACLRISGPMLKARPNCVAAEITGDTQPARDTFQCAATAFGLPAALHGSMNISWDSTTDEEQGWRKLHGRTLYFIALCGWDWESPRAGFSGLLLTRLSSDRAAYSRVGFCWHDRKNKAARGLLFTAKALLDVVRSHSHLDDDDSFLERHDDGTYTIEIW